MKDTKLTHSFPARVAALLLLMLISAGIIVSGITVIFAANHGMYYGHDNFYESSICRDIAFNEYYFGIWNRYFDSREDFEEYVRENFRGNTLVVLSDASGKVLVDTKGSIAAQPVFTDMSWTAELGSFEDGEYDDALAVRTEFRLDIYVRESLKEGDQYYTAYRLYQWIYQARNNAIAVLAVLGLCAIVLYIFLLCSAGHKKGSDDCELIRQDRIPLDLYLTGAGLVIAGALSLGGQYMDYYLSALVVMCVAMMVVAFCLYLTSMTLAARFKAGKWWRNSIIYVVLRFIWRVLQKIMRGMNHFIQRLPLTWRVLTVFVVYGFVSFLLTAFLISDGDFLTFLVLMGLNIGMLALLYILTMQMRLLQRGGEALAKGNLDHKVETDRLLFDFKKHGENLNQVNDGITKAVDERMRSERFKTELITNVSHDIKTPLTAIISYVDLLRKESSGDAHTEQYLEVLERQSAKLKKLTEDIIEASKASAGVIKANKEYLNVAELLTQSLAEYGDRLFQSNITPVMKAPETGAYIYADGRLLWRVFDNILSNVQKYAMPGSRAYFDVAADGKTVEITVKNVSANQLNISAQELMERFVQGDSSRKSEGSGLGLSISRSLTELQGGSFDIFLDGDLFKIVLRFPEHNLESKAELPILE